MEGTTVTPTASTGTESTSTPTATSAGTTTSATSTPSERPRTMQEAFSRESDSTTQPDAATTQPVDGSTPQTVHPSTQGPIPFAAHKTALDNARLKATQDAQTTFDRDFGWAKSVPRESLERFSSIAQRMSSDPIGFLGDFVKELESHPVHAASLRSQAGRLLAGGRTQPQAEMPTPDVQIVDAQGNVTGTTYSADQLAKRDAWTRSQLLAEVNKELQPIKEEREKKVAQAKATESIQRAEKAADQRMSRADQILDGNKDLYQHVANLMASDPSLEVEDAALQVRKAHILPALQGKAQTALLESLKTKANAQGVNPASAVVSATHRPRSLTDKSLQW